MQNLQEINLFNFLAGGKKGNPKSTPGTVGNSLFQNFLTQMCKPSKGGHPGLSLYSGRQVKGEKNPGNSLFQGTGFQGTVLKGKGASLTNVESNKDVLEDLNDKIHYLGISSGQVILPAASVPKLISFLRQQGLGEAEIDRFLINSRTEGGSLRLDKLLPQILGYMDEKNTAQTNLVVESRDVPQVEEIIYKMGLGSGEVKEIIEKAAEHKGNIEINQLSKALNDFSTAPVSEDKLASLLEKSEIRLKSGIADQKTMEPELKKEFMNLANATSPDMQKVAKQNIAALLTEKGIPPQEVKTFLETLSVDYSKTILKNIVSTDSDLDELLNQVSIKQAQGLGKTGWQAKISGNLKGVGPAVSEDTGKNLFQGKTETDSGFMDIFREDGQKLKKDILQQVSELKTQPPLRNEKAFFKVGDKTEASTNSKETLGPEINILKPNLEQSKINLSTQVRNNFILPEPLPKVFDRMVWMIRAGEQKSRIMITPPELGRLDLEISMKQGHIQANLSAESLVVKEIIEANLNQLKQQLTEQGFSVDKFEVMVGLNDKGFKDGERWASNKKKVPFSPGGSGTEEDSLKVNKGRSLSRTNDPNQIDVHV